jgi:hypothetical protein
VTYDTTWAEIDENDPEGSIYFLIKVQLGSDVAWGWLANPDLYVHGVAIEIEELFATEEGVKEHRRILAEYAAQSDAEQGRDEDEERKTHLSLRQRRGLPLDSSAPKGGS